MSLKTVIQFPIFAPADHRRRRPPTEVRFSRWNNANAEKFIRHERAQKELEDELRFQKRFDSALNIAHNYNPAPPHPTTFKSAGTPSSPSSPSIPGKFSKYSKSPKYPSEKSFHPAFKPLLKPRKVPVTNPEVINGEEEKNDSVSPNFKIGENGVSYEFPEAPFEYQYSYTETPKLKPVKLREPLVSPFGPGSMPKPYLGRKPLPPSKKKLPEFDSFQLPPPHKKGVKPVQAPGPFLPGSGPKHMKSREEILGELLTKDEIKDLIEGCKKSNRQLNMGRDGLTHNMLDNIHAHWKRRRVCKIKCKGVCTVDMDNVLQQLEEKTGGKVIYSRGGVLYLFRGRNYNYKTRPRFPLMLWKPITPVYPRLIKRVPEGLTLEEASEMRKRGRNLTPICKLAKNGVYCDLVNNVREAFEACELVRINCQGLNGSDYRKIGAKLKDLVPCVLISFECEHILVWRGRDWRSSLAEPVKDPKEMQGVECDDGALKEPVASSSSVPAAAIVDLDSNNRTTSTSPTFGNEEPVHGSELSNTRVEGLSAVNASSEASCAVMNMQAFNGIEKSPSHAEYTSADSEAPKERIEGEILLDGFVASDGILSASSENLESSYEVTEEHRKNVDEQMTSSLAEPIEGSKEMQEVECDDGALKEPVAAPSCSVPDVSIVDLDTTNLNTSTSPTFGNEEPLVSNELSEAGVEHLSAVNMSSEASLAILNMQSVNGIGNAEYSSADSEALNERIEGEILLDVFVESDGILSASSENLNGSNVVPDEHQKNVNKQMSSSTPWTEGVLLLRKQAVECGRATVLDDHYLDADYVFKTSVAFAKSAPTGPVFRRRPKKSAVHSSEKKETGDLELKEAPAVTETETASGGQRRSERKSSRNEKMKDIKADYLNVAPQGSLRVDELAKLLA